MSKIFDSINIYGTGTTTGPTLRTFNTSGTSTLTVLDNGNVGINSESPSVKLDVRGDAIFNEDGGNFDFRIEGQSDQNLFFVDASTSSIGIGTNSTNLNEKITVQSNNRTSLNIINQSTDALTRECINVSTQGGGSSTIGSAGIRTLAQSDTNKNFGIEASGGGTFQQPSTSFVRNIGVLGSAIQSPSGGNIAALGGVLSQPNSGDSYGIYISVTNPGTGTKYIGRLTDGTEGAGKVLTSDSLGRASWQTPSIGSTVTGQTTFTGGISANTISATTIGSPTNCVDDLYVSNIHSCSPLNINPLNEGNVYFGSTSGVTIDVINSRVGIGTVVPTDRLTVDGKTKTTNLQVTSGAVSGYLLTSDNNGNATWQVNSATTITINNNSNNRIITATGNNDEINGESNLTFDGNTLTSIKNSSSPNLIIRDTGTTSTDAYIRFLGLSGGTPSWAMGVNKGINNDFEIRYSSGSGASLANTLAFAIQSASTGFYSYQFGPNNSVKIVTAPDAGQIRLRDNISDVETTLTRFTNYTAIGANDGSTDEPFYINNDSNSGRTSFGGGGVGGSLDQMEFYPDPRTDLPVNGGSGLYIKNNLSVDGTVRVGSVTSTGVAVYRNASTGILTTTSSDVRLKKDITQITNPLDIINNLRGVYYNWQSNDDFETDDTSRQIGLIAQEVEPVLPEAVVLNGLKDYKTVKYSEIVSVLIEGMKEQQKMINDLKQEIENLKNP
jgi:hypothetical protein